MASKRWSEFDSVAGTMLGTDVMVLARGGQNYQFTLADVPLMLDPVLRAFGIPDTTFEFNSSSLTGLTAISNAPDVVDADTSVPGHLFLRDDAAVVTGRYAATPSPPFTAITHIRTNLDTGSGGEAGLFVGEATPGVIESIGFNPVSNANSITQVRWTNPNTFGSSPATFGAIGFPGEIWVAIVVFSDTDIDFYYSLNGYTWKALSLAKNPSITVGSVGVLLEAGGTVSEAAFEYLRIWNSAKTFPGVVT